MHRTLSLAAGLCLVGVLASSSAAAQEFSTPKRAALKRNEPLAPPSNLVAATGADDCAMAFATASISGSGTFTVNSVGATTAGPAAACGGSGNEVWFYWTPTSTGVATITLCGGGALGDSVVTLWADNNATACPSGTAIACNDDSCGLLSTISAPVVSGTGYFIEFGSFGGGAGYTGTFMITVVGPPANDSCATPTVLAGPGPYAFDLTNTTTGTQGQMEAACLFFGLNAIHRDAWYTWVAPSTGVATVETCAQTGVDTKIAAYAGQGCPSSAPLACNDDACSLQTRVRFLVQSGQAYTLQVGTYPGAAGGTGTFSITVAVPDDCAMAAPIGGTGTYAVDSTTATTGAPLPGCASAGRDVWYLWTAPSSGNATVRTCGGVTADSVLAVWADNNAGACPSGMPLVCNDDSCGLQSEVTTAVMAGNRYFIQLATFGSGAGYSGTFTIAITAPPVPMSCEVLDDGMADNSVGLTGGGDVVWMLKQGAPGLTTLVHSISTAYGEPGGAGMISDGFPTTVAIWEDPNDDGVPSDLVLVAFANSTIQNINTNTFNVTGMPGNTVVTGTYFVGVLCTHPNMSFPAPLDQTGPSAGNSWVAGGAAVDINNISAAPIPPTLLSAIPGLNGRWLLRVDCTTTTGTTFCEGTAAACPCANAGAALHGCANSANVAGGLLAARGAASLSGDTVRLMASGMPNSSSFVAFAQSTATNAGVAYGDGVLCVTGSITRIARRAISSGKANFGNGIPGDLPVSVAGGIAAPGTFHYQVVYRDAVGGFCTPNTFSVTNGVSITWTP